MTAPICPVMTAGALGTPREPGGALVPCCGSRCAWWVREMTEWEYQDDGVFTPIEPTPTGKGTCARNTSGEGG